MINLNNLFISSFFAAFLYTVSTFSKLCKQIQSAVKSLFELFTNTIFNVWQTVVHLPLANFVLSIGTADSLVDAPKNEDASNQPCLMKITRVDQRSTKVQTSNHNGNELKAVEEGKVNQPSVHQINQGVDMELLLKSLAITLQTMLNSILQRMNSISYLMESQLLVKVENNRLEVYKCNCQAKLQLLQHHQHKSTKLVQQKHCQKLPNLSFSLRFQCQCQISSLIYDIDDLGEHIIDRQSGLQLPVPLSLASVGSESVSLLLRHRFHCRDLIANH